MINQQHTDFYDDYDDEISQGNSDQAHPSSCAGSGDDWDDEGLTQATFPIGYTIQFSPPPLHEEERGENVDAPRGGLGSQALPVPTSMRADWDGIPTDGAEYLFTVRQEAKSRPRVVAKVNPYAFETPSQASSCATSSISSSSLASPCPKWRNQFAIRFSNIRKSLQDHEPVNWVLDDTYRKTPPANDESNWKIFIFGKKHIPDASDPISIEYLGRKTPTPIFLKALDQSTVVGILSHYTGWIEERLDALMCLIEQHAKPTPAHPDEDGAHEITLLSAHDGAWLLGLLSILDSVLTSEDIYKLRALARVCKRVAQIADAASKQANSTEDSSHQEAAAGWMVVAAIADVWGQKDLWED